MIRGFSSSREFLLVLTAAWVGCGGGGPEREGSLSQPLAVALPSLWPSPVIKACIRNPEAATDEQIQWVKDGASRWEAVSAVTFEWIAACQGGWTIEGINITFSDEREHVDRLGRYAAPGSTFGSSIMSLNPSFQNDKTGCNDWDPFTDPRGVEWPYGIQYCMTVAATHEFGHALAFDHEFERPDSPGVPPTPRDCVEAASDLAAFGWWDPYSVMLQSYCGISSMGYLSPTDIAGVQAYYGHRSDDYLWLVDGNMRTLLHDWAQQPHDPPWPEGYVLPARIGVTARAEAVGGQYPRAFTGDFNGDGFGDIFWYRPGPGGDSIWFGGPGAAWVKAAGTDVSGTYTPVVGDFNCDLHDDIFWYGPGNGRETVWWGRHDGTFLHTSTLPVAGSTYRPVAGRFNGDSCDDIFWYGPGASLDSVWFGSWDGDFHSRRRTRSIGGDYQPFAGDYDGDGLTDVFLYASGNPAASPDGVLWANGGTSVFSARQDFPVTGTYRIAVGDFDGNQTEDLFFDHTADTTDFVWLWRHGQRAYLDTPTSLLGTFTPLVGDFDWDGIDDIFWHGE